MKQGTSCCQIIVVSWTK